MERLDSFVAGSLLQRLRPRDGDLTAPTGASFRGAVLFVDISGYTTLAEALCSQGPMVSNNWARRSTWLCAATCAPYRATGGEIACFAGDAFIAYWSADDGNIPRALRKAHDCAAALHAGSRADAPSSAGTQPTLHIGVSAGEIWAARLCNEDRLQLLLAGPAVRQACTAAVRAAAGTTVVSPEAGPFMAARDEAGASRLPIHPTLRCRRR